MPASASGLPVCLAMAASAAAVLKAAQRATRTLAYQGDEQATVALAVFDADELEVLGPPTSMQVALGNKIYGSP